MSFAGRLTLIKSVVSCLPSFYISVFKMPKGVVKTIEKLQASFLWGDREIRRKVHLVRWQELMSLKVKEGLGIRSIADMNDCMLLKWWWRYGVEDKALWKEAVCSKYERVGGSWWPEMGEVGKVSLVWQGILNIAEENPQLSFTWIM